MCLWRCDVAEAKAVAGGEAALLGEAAKETALALTSSTREQQAADVAESSIAAGRRILSRHWTQVRRSRAAAGAKAVSGKL